MTTYLGPILAMALMAQLQSPTMEGKVVDEQGKPVADAQVVYFVPRHFDGSGDTLELQTRTGPSGQFRLVPVNRRASDQAFLWAYLPGFAVAVTREDDSSATRNLILRKPKAKTLKLEGPDGKPVVGAIVAPGSCSTPPRTGSTRFPRRSPDRFR